MNALKPNAIAFLLLLSSVGLMIYLFAASRHDPSLRIAALVSGTGLVSALSSIASTMLTGKDVNAKGSPSDLPKGGAITNIESTKVEVPPTQPEQAI